LVLKFKNKIAKKESQHYLVHQMKLADTLNFIAKASIYKTWNASKIVSSYYLSKWLNRPIQWGLPISISIEPTTDCNLGCPECPSGVKFFTRPTGYLDMVLFEKFLSQTASHLFYLYYYFQGEPYLHPQFLDMVKMAADKKIYTVTSTNGHFLSGKKAALTVASGLDRIIISLDGTTQETYAKYRIGGKYERVIEGIRNLVAAKKEADSNTPHIVLQFIVMQHNEHQIAEVKKLATELAVDELKLKSVQVYDLKNNSALIPTNTDFARYQEQDGELKIKSNLLNHCWKLWHSCVVTWDGKIAPCCFDKDASHRMGDLQSASFASIWKNETYQRFRANIITARANIDICTNCSEGIDVWLEND